MASSSRNFKERKILMGNNMFCNEKQLFKADLKDNLH